MKKGLYLVYNILNLKRPDGIEKKILSQKKLFQGAGFDMKFKILQRKNGTYWNYKTEYSEYDLIYFRKSTVIDWRFIHFFKQIKKDNPKIKVFMDIPTYPYEGEFGSTLRARFSLGVDKLFRNFVVNVIDRIIVTGYSDKKNIWGVQTINIVNGIDLDEIPKRHIDDSSYTKDEIVISCIAKFSPWHGYERLITGLKQYNDSKHTIGIKLIMVGEGIELNHYKDMVNQYNLNNCIEFTGQLIGDQLQKVYDRTDIGCCSLGRFKSGIDVIGDLKSREFMAEGIPMICGCDIDVLKGQDYKYAIFFPNNNSPIDLHKVVEFYNSLLNEHTQQELYIKIRNEAERLVNLKRTYLPVLKEAQTLIW